MNKVTAIAIVLLTGASTVTAEAAEPVSTTSGSQADSSRTKTYSVVDIRPDMARTHLKQGRNTVYTDGKGRKLQAEVNKKGEITGYVSVDQHGKASKVKTESSDVTNIGSGEMALVHKCWAVTQECVNNPLPRSGKPEDCMVEIECPKPALSTLLTR